MAIVAAVAVSRAPTPAGAPSARANLNVGLAIDRAYVGGGGGQSNNGPLALVGTIGQPSASLVRGGPFALYGGFAFRATVVQRGDCNHDAAIDAGDLSGLLLEVFDGDGVLDGDVPSGSYAGDAVGCDANADGLVSAPDFTCVVLEVFRGLAACG